MIIFWILVYVAALIGLSVWLSRSNSNEDFLIAGRNRSSLQIFFSKFAGSIGVAWFLVYTGFAYQYGLSTIWVIPGFIIAFLLFAFWAGPRVYAGSHEGKFYTQGDYVRSKTGSQFTKRLVDSISVVIFLFWILVSFIGGAKVIEYLGCCHMNGRCY